MVMTLPPIHPSTVVMNMTVMSDEVSKYPPTHVKFGNDRPTHPHTRTYV